MEAKRITTAELAAHEGQEVSLCGHVYALRNLGKVCFLILRDRHGSLQVVINGAAETVPTLAVEQAVIVNGKLQSNEGRPGSFELQATKLTPLSAFASALPVEISKEKRMEKLGLPALLDYRPLTLRNEKVRSIFKIEAEICRAFRQYLSDFGFTEIHSPKIVSTGTEGGAQLFALDYFGTHAYLAQSPQFYKQTMVAVFERVFEIGPVYRAEEHNTPRHLNEYVSMDIEMGFIESEQDLIFMQTGLLRYIFAHIEEYCRHELALWSVRPPSFQAIPQIKLSEARELLTGRLGWSPKEDAAGSGGPENLDLDPEAERLLCRHFAETEGIDLVYVTHYPQAVRPFYALPEPGTMMSKSFDLLYNGLEITTGGLRIHEYDRLVASMRQRGMDPESFADYLQCFRYGMPPHGGLAIGLERLTKQLLGLANVRQASLFPRDGGRLSP